jgi:hypothetical protein
VKNNFFAEVIANNTVGWQLNNGYQPLPLYFDFPVWDTNGFLIGFKDAEKDQWAWSYLQKYPEKLSEFLSDF